MLRHATELGGLICQWYRSGVWVALGDGAFYRHGQCWHDVYDAMSQARRLIYITGWSVFYTIHLVCDGDGGGKKGLSLGDLLKMKSKEGVRVLLLVWDDPTSRSVLGIKMSFACRKVTWAQGMKRPGDFSIILQCRYCSAQDLLGKSTAG